MSNYSKAVTNMCITIAMLICLPLVTYGGYHLNNYINWDNNMEKRVEDKIKEMVKEESLK